jgi:hypothetical protein
LVGAQQRPVPTRAIPITIGGTGTRTLGLVRDYADWWNVPLHQLDQLDGKRTAAGAARVSVQQMVAVVSSESERAEVTETAVRRFGGMQPVIGTLDELSAHFAHLMERGVERFYVWFADFAPPSTLHHFGELIRDSSHRWPFVVLYVFAFERLGVVLSDLYFVDPHPGPGQEGAERGVRLELRFMERGHRGGSVYASQPITIDSPIWRVDLLESVDNPGSLDRAHHHPQMTNWEPGNRRFVPDLTADPLAWLAGRLEDIRTVLDIAEVDRTEIDDSEIDQLQASAPEIVEAVRRVLKGIADGDLARAPESADSAALVRESWL